MAKITAPLLSQSASGQFGKHGLIFSQRRSGQQVRDYHKPRGEASSDQMVQRQIIGLLTAQWRCMTQSQKDVYNTLAHDSGEKITGFNYFVRAGCANMGSVNGLIFFWPFEEKSGDTVFDASGNGKNGTTYNITQRCTHGRVGCAIGLNGVNQYVGLAAPSIGPAPVTGTYAFWYKPNVTLNAASPVKYFVNRQGGPYFVYNYVAGKLQYLQYNNASVLSQAGVTMELTAGRWYHICGVHTASKIYLYVDGVKVDEQNATLTTTFQASKGFYVGIRFDLAGVYCNGTIDSVAGWNRNFSAAEVKMLQQLMVMNYKRQVYP